MEGAFKGTCFRVVAGDCCGLGCRAVVRAVVAGCCGLGCRAVVEQLLRIGMLRCCGGTCCRIGIGILACCGKCVAPLALLPPALQQACLSRIISPLAVGRCTAEHEPAGTAKPRCPPPLPYEHGMTGNGGVPMSSSTAWLSWLPAEPT
eukprot:220654-Chlamydomonas_euryale.AAC.1